jgi:tetratricopeptide (TPR) repeat protein
MKRLLLTALFGGFLVAAAQADTIFTHDPATKKDTRENGTVQEESPTGIKIRMGTKVREIPAAQVLHIDYDNPTVPATSFREPYGKEMRALQAAPRSAARRTHLTEALQGYRQLDDQLKGTDKIHRYLQYKIGLMQAMLAEDTPGEPALVDAAIAALKQYKTDFPDGWEIVPALKRLALLQEEKGDTAGAGETYAALADVPGLPAAAKQEYLLRVVGQLLRGGKFPEAEKRLQDMEKPLSTTDPQRPFVEVYLTQCRLAQGKLDGVKEQLEAALGKSEDPRLRALAHNFLGDYYLARKQPEEAFWHYLKVDTLYNQDREEQAKALFHLAKLFDKPKNDLVRSEECINRVRGKDFVGTEYQRRLPPPKSETEKPETDRK